MSTSNPLISVIIPVYGAAPYIERCIEGWLGQTMARERFEVLFVDNNSPDNSAEMIRAHEPAVRLLHEPKQGAYAARNRALREVRGEILAFSDPDCVPQRDWLEQVERGLAGDNSAVVLGRNDPPPGSEAMRLIGLYEHHSRRFILDSTDPTLYYGYTNNMAVTHAAMDRYGPFEEWARGGDTILVRRIIEHMGVGAVAYLPEMRVVHLEVARAAQFLHKAYLYGKSWRGYREIVATRPVNRRERAAIWRSLCAEERLTRGRRARLWMWLFTGAMSFKAGSLAGRFASGKKPSPNSGAAAGLEVSG